VDYRPQDNLDGTRSDRWRCLLCQADFWPQHWFFPPPWQREAGLAQAGQTEEVPDYVKALEEGLDEQAQSRSFQKRVALQKGEPMPTPKLTCLCSGEAVDAYCPVHGAHVQQPRAASGGALSAEPLPPWPCLSCGGDGGHKENCLGDLHIRENIERRILVALAAHDQKVREPLVAWMVENSFATGHGDSVEDLLKELKWQVEELRAAKRAEP